MWRKSIGSYNQKVWALSQARLQPGVKRRRRRRVVSPLGSSRCTDVTSGLPSAGQCLRPHLTHIPRAASLIEDELCFPVFPKKSWASVALACLGSLIHSWTNHYSQMQYKTENYREAANPLTPKVEIRRRMTAHSKRSQDSRPKKGRGVWADASWWLTQN